MTVYILIGTKNYLGDSVLGVFATHDKAIDFVERKRVLSHYDDYDIREETVQ